MMILVNKSYNFFKFRVPNDRYDKKTTSSKDIRGI
jgi:hypothetical protein